MSVFAPFRRSSLCLCLLALAGCAQLGLEPPEDGPDRPAGTMADAEIAAVAPDAALTAAPPPPPAARTQEALDTTSAAQRAEAATVAPDTTSRMLGTTIVSLGSPAEPGFWLKTPLVKTQTKGRVTNKANGKSSAVTLIPIDGPATGGSRLSLPAMRLIEASLVDLTEVEVALEG